MEDRRPILPPFSASPRERMCPGDCLTWAPLPSGFQMDLANGRSWQKTRGGRGQRQGVPCPLPPFLTAVLPWLPSPAGRPLSLLRLSLGSSHLTSSCPCGTMSGGGFLQLLI